MALRPIIRRAGFGRRGLPFGVYNLGVLWFGRYRPPYTHNHQYSPTEEYYLYCHTLATELCSLYFATKLLASAEELCNVLSACSNMTSLCS